jgi:Ca2+-binding EF-hand superfamily protein
MSMQILKNGLRVLGLGLATLAGSATAGAQSPDAMDSLDKIQDTGRTIFKLVDENNDGQISQKEAVDAGNVLVGGFFFRADTNGDGVVSQEEAKASRETFLAQKPWLRFVIGRVESSKPASTNGTQNPAAVFMGLVDANGDKNLQATEVRQAIQTSVQGFFAAADTNRDELLNPVEVNAAIVGAVKAAEQATFQAADVNHDGQISKDEFVKALTDPANAAFAILDANNDGQLSQAELQQAGRILEGQIKRTMLPEPPNSLKHLIESGQKPNQVAPIPKIPVPNRTGNTTAPGVPPQQ